MTHRTVAQEVWESTAMAASKLVASRRYYFVYHQFLAAEGLNYSTRILPYNQSTHHQGSLDKIMNLNYYKE